MYPGTTKIYSTQPIWLSQPALLRAPTPFLNFGLTPRVSPRLTQTSLRIVVRLTLNLSVVKCVWEVFVWEFGVLFLSCACVSVSGVLFSVGVCV